MAWLRALGLPLRKASTSSYVATRGNASVRGNMQCERAAYVEVTAPTERNITLYLIEKLVKGLFLASAIFSENWPIR